MAGSHKASRGGPFILVTDTCLQDHEPELHHSRGRNHDGPALCREHDEHWVTWSLPWPRIA